MAEKRTKRKHKIQKPRKERRFEPIGGGLPVPAVVLLWLGALGLGGGVWARWVADPPQAAAWYLLAGSCALIVAGLVLGGGGVPVRVGDAGVALEKGNELVRLAWCDISRISLDGRMLVVRGEELALKIPLQPHRQAVAWILSETANRVPDVLDVKSDVVSELPKPSESLGELLTVEDVQVTGRRCANCEEVVSMARDARLCGICGQVYHQNHVPKQCATCEQPLAGQALRTDS